MSRHLSIRIKKYLSGCVFPRVFRSRAQSVQLCARQSAVLWGASGAQEGAHGDAGGIGGRMGGSVGAKGKRKAEWGRSAASGRIGEFVRAQEIVDLRRAA